MPSNPETNEVQRLAALVHLAGELGFSESFDMKILRNRIVGLMERWDNLSEPLSRYETMAMERIKSEVSHDFIEARIGFMVMGLTLYLDAAAGTPSELIRNQILATFRKMLKQTLDHSKKMGLDEFEHKLHALTGDIK